MAFTHKQISVAFQYASGTSKTIGNRRINVQIATPGGQDKGTAEIAIFGMSLSDMNALSVLPTQVNSIGANTVTVMAGDDASGMSMAFQGNVQAALVQGTALPDVPFVVNATAGLAAEQKPAKPFSQPGSIDVGKTMGQLAQQAGFAFENNLTNPIMLENRYLWGGLMQQIRTLAREAGIEHVVEKGTLAVFNPGGTRSGDAVEVNPSTGLVGLPQISASGLQLTTIYNPSLNFGSKVNVTSMLTPACGIWSVSFIHHALDAETPDGRWFTTLTCTRLQAQPPSN